jgi:riboflavin synthase
MFTGLIEKVGKLESVRSTSEGTTLTVYHDSWDLPVKDGESIAVQGCCLTARHLDDTRFCCDVLLETLRKTNLRKKEHGSLLNLERALRVGDRFGGHIVSGHVDGTGTVLRMKRVGRDWELEIDSQSDLLQYLVLKGSVCCDGVSLTLTSVSDANFSVHLIPFTWQSTSLSKLEPGATVNIEVDLMAKYVMKFTSQNQPPPTSLTLEDLRNAGFV